LFGTQLKALREGAGFTQEELATIAGLSVHAVSALERGERRRPHVETVRALAAALDVTGASRDALVGSARPPVDLAAADELSSSSVPVPPTALIGRDTDVQLLRQWLAESTARLVTLIGPGGVGKTRLALELARIIADERTTQVVFVPLAAVDDPALVAPTIAEALGLADVSAVDLPKRARTACEHHHTLLVLDNFERVLDAAPLVAELLASVPRLQLLITSRAPLRVRGEREYVVGPLAYENADATSAADLAPCPAVQLFTERVRDLEPEFRLTPGNSATVAAICRRLDALPLALELAAPWAKLLTPEGLLQRLQQDVLLSSVGARDLPERQQTMNATVAWSYQLLGPGEQRAFRLLGALPGRFAIDAAAAVLAQEGLAVTHDEALAAIADIMDKSLLLRAESSVPKRQLYRMLDTVRAYAALELVARGENEDAMEGLAGYCTSEAALASTGLLGPAQVEWLDRVRNDLENYRAAMAWLIERGRCDDAAHIALALKYFWLIRGHVAEGLRWYEQILGTPWLSPAAEAMALVGAALMWYAQGELDRARTALDRVLPLARAASDIDLVAQAEHTMGHVERAAGRLDAARERFARSLEQCRLLKDLTATGKALTGMAAVAFACGDAVEAERLLDEAASALRHGGPWLLSFVLWLRALLAVRRGNADEAIGWVRESLVRIRELNDKFAFVYALVALSAAAVLDGNHMWAARILGVRDAVAERTGATLVDRTIHALRAQAERDARTHLGVDRWVKAYTAGRCASVDSLLNDIECARARSRHTSSETPHFCLT
jgi:predicted ATPase/DNA-binding XRE family transcriptional regulator